MMNQNRPEISKTIGVLFVLFALVIVCLVIVVPADHVTVDDLYKMSQNTDGSHPDVMQVLEYHSFYLEIIFNGERYNLSGDGNLYLSNFIGGTDGEGFRSVGISYLTFDLMEKEIWGRSDHGYNNQDFYVWFADIYSDEQISYANSLYLTRKDDCRLSAPEGWDGRDILVTVWDFPGDELIVLDWHTLEVVTPDTAYVITYDGNILGIIPGNGPLAGKAEISEIDGKISLTIDQRNQE